MKLFNYGWVLGNVVALRLKPKRVRSNCEVHWNDEPADDTRDCLLNMPEYFHEELDESSKAELGAWFFIDTDHE